MSELELKEVNPKDLIPNDWNPNVLTDLKYRSLKNSIKRFPEILQGQRIIVRVHPTEKGKFQILNGEHRNRIATELKHKTVPIGIIDEPDDNKAKLISLALANVGEEDYDRKLGVIYDIQKDIDLAEIANLIGEDKNALATIVDELHQDTGSLAETFAKYTAPTEAGTPKKIAEDYFETLGINPGEIAKNEIPSMLKLPVSGNIRKAIQKGFDAGLETAYSVIQEACKVYVEQGGDK